MVEFAQSGWSLLAPDDFVGMIGGNGSVFGTAQAQVITIIPVDGMVQLDPSFNRGGEDTLQLPGAASDWTVSVSGSNAVLTSDLTSVSVPLGTDGLTLSFDDGPRTLSVDPESQTALLGNQQLGEEPAVIIADPEGDPSFETLPLSGVSAQVVMATGGDVTLAGNYAVFGTSGEQTVDVMAGGVAFDSSFNRGDDSISLAGSGPDFTVSRFGSSAIIVSDDAEIVLPAGVDGLALEFTDGVRTLRYDDFLDQIMVGAQTVLDAAAQLGASPDALQDMVLVWNDAALDAIAAASVAPPEAARVLAIQGLAILDAIAAVGASDPFLVDVSSVGAVDLNAIVAYASHTVLSQLIPSQADAFDSLLAQVQGDLGTGAASDNGMATGIASAEAVLAARSNDGSSGSVEYVYGDQPGEWVAAPPSFPAPALPHWASVDTFALSSADQFRAPPPPALDSEEYAEALAEVYALGGLDSEARTEDQSEIAVFWLDGAGTYTPPGHWNAIAAEVGAAEGLTTAENALMFAMLNVAMADAGIAAWDSKYTHQFWRPVTAINNADLDGNDATLADLEWTPYLPTPNHPTYVSGHSTFSGAAAAVMTQLFGEDYAFETGGVGVPGVMRSFDSFEEAAAEGGISRIYGGIHYSFDNEVGLAMGDNIGNWTVDAFAMSGAGSVSLMA